VNQKEPEIEPKGDGKSADKLLKRVVARAKDAPEPERQLTKRKQPGPPKNVGDDSPNPLPDDPSECGGEGGGDPGRTS
jgi:hypothetical protein